MVALALARFDQLLGQAGSPDFAGNKVAAGKRKGRNVDAAKHFRLELCKGPSNAADLKLQRLGKKSLVDNDPPHFDRHIAILLSVIGKRFVDIEPFHRPLERQLKESHHAVGDKEPHDAAGQNPKHGSKQVGPQFLEVLAESHRRAFKQVVVCFACHDWGTTH